MFLITHDPEKNVAGRVGPVRARQVGTGLKRGSSAV